jgi:hypothetical protein
MEKIEKLGAFLQKFEGLDGRVCIVFLVILVIVAAFSIHREYGNIKLKNWKKFFF